MASKSIFVIVLLSVAAANGVAAQGIFSNQTEKLIEVVLSDGFGAEKGAWRTRVQSIFASGPLGVERRAYEVFDPAPSRDLIFSWEPDDINADRPGRISGVGKLSWRRRDAPAYSQDSVVAVYRGTMRDGKPSGQGRYVAQDGFVFDGRWREGRAHGQGQLRLPSGEQYEGRFRDGFAEGSGFFTDTTWERFDGTFHRGLRQGAGKTVLPSGLAYRSDWQGGRETANSQRVRLAQAGDTNRIGGAQDVGFGVTVNNDVRLPEEVRKKEVLLYAARMTSDGLRVEPSDKEMVDTWMGRRPLSNHEFWGTSPRDGMFSIEKGYVQPVGFKLDVLNKSGQTVEIQSVMIRVKNSQTENRPAIDITSPYVPGCGSALTPEFTLYNYGWGKALTGIMQAGFVDGGSSTRPSSLAYQIKIGDLDQTKKIGYEHVLSQAGVNMKELQSYSSKDDSSAQSKHLPCGAKDKNACLAALRKHPMFGKIGPFLRADEGTVYVTMAGDYSYKWIDSRGREQNTVAQFAIPVGLGVLPREIECGAGGPPEPLRNETIKLRLDATNYIISSPFRRAVPPGRTASVTLRLDADKSSTHEFEFVARLGDGRELVSPHVDLLYYRPRLPATN